MSVERPYVMVGVTGCIPKLSRPGEDRARAAEGGRAREGNHDRGSTHFVDPVTFGRSPTEGGGGAVRRSVRSHSPHFARPRMRRVPYRAVHANVMAKVACGIADDLLSHHGPGDHV